MPKSLCTDASVYDIIMLKHQKEINVNYRYEGKNLISIKLNKDICKKYR